MRTETGSGGRDPAAGRGRARRSLSSRGSALLAVLWLTAALSAIAFSVANTVRGEIERTATLVDGVRSYYLATGAIDRAICYILWGPGPKNPNGSPRYWAPGIPRLHFRFPTGEAIVEIIPASAKLNLNTATPAELTRLLLAIGAPPERAREIALAIVDWRSPVGKEGFDRFDQYYLNAVPSFRARHASFEQLEEVLLVKGMTPELFYGTYVRGPGGRLIRRSGLRDCVSLYGVQNRFAVNSADPALLRSIGIRDDAVRQIVERRRRAPILQNQIGALRQLAGPGGKKLVVGGNGSIFTLRATARYRLPNGQLSDLRRSVAATVKFFRRGSTPPYQILRWHDYSPTGTVVWP